MLCCLLLGDVAAHEAEEVLLGGALRTVVEFHFETFPRDKLPRC